MGWSLTVLFPDGMALISVVLRCRRVQAAVDRRFDRARHDAERVVAQFSERLPDPAGGREG